MHCLCKGMYHAQAQVLRKLKAVPHTRGLSYDSQEEFVAALSASGLLQVWEMMTGKQVLNRKKAGPEVCYTIFMLENKSVHHCKERREHLDETQRQIRILILRIMVISGLSMLGCSLGKRLAKETLESQVYNTPLIICEGKLTWCFKTQMQGQN